MMVPPPLVAPCPDPRVYESEVSGQRVLFNSRDRRLHVLNSSAGAIWDALGGAGTIGEVADVLSERFGTVPRVVRPDVERIVDQFHTDGLVAANAHDAGHLPASRPHTKHLAAAEAGAFRVAALDAVIGVESTDPDVQAALAQVFSPLLTDRPPTVSMRVAESDQGSWVIQLLGAEPIVVGSRLAAVLRAIGEANNVAVASIPDHLVFHAGAIGGMSGVALLPAASNHGKSTLTAALVSSGCDYLTDEAAAIGPGRVCRPFPKSITLDPGSFPLFPNLAPPSGDGLVGAMRGREWHVDPARIGKVGTTGEVTVIVCPHWRAGSTTRVSRCPPTEALHLLIGEVFDFSQGGQMIFERLSELVDNVPVYRLGYSDMNEAVSAVRALLDDPHFIPGRLAD